MRAFTIFPAALALACAAPAFAQHVAQTNTTVDADAYVLAPGSPGPGGRARVRAENGSITVIQDSRYFQYDPDLVGPPADPDASVSYGTANNHTRAFAITSESGVVGPNAYSSYSSSAVDLAAGTVKAEALNTGPTRAGRAITRSFMADTLFFTNTGPSAVLLSVTFSVHGTILDPHGQGNAGGQAQLRLFTGTLGGGRVNFASSGGAANGDSNAYFTAAQGIHTFTGGPNFTLTGNASNFSISTTLSIPTGQSSLGVWLGIYLDCAGGSSCDYGNTGTITLGALPGGLSYSSASGVFLTAQQGAVPEPAVWVTLVLGFGLLGARMRRRSERYAIA